MTYQNNSTDPVFASVQGIGTTAVDLGVTVEPSDVDASPGHVHLQGGRGRLRHLLRNMAVCSISLVVLGSLAIYLAAPEGEALAMSRTTAPIPGSAIVIYGKVDTSRGRPLPGVRVEVASTRGDRDRDHDSGWMSAYDRVTYTGANGTYRIGPPAGVYTVTMTARVHDGKIRASTRVDARPGRAYDVSAKVLSNGSVFFTPLFSY